MPGAGKAEVYFIAAMMVLILVFSFTASYFFIRQYRREMREKADGAATRGTIEKTPTDAKDPDSKP